MPKAEFARGTITYGGTLGITDISIDETWTEIDVTDTESTLQESEYLGGRRSYTVSFTTFKNAGTADLTMNTSAEAVITVLDSAANSTVYTGDLILLTKNISGTIDDAVKISYSGRVTGALAETQP